MLKFARSALRMLPIVLVLMAGAGLISASADTANSAELIMLEEEGCPWCDLWREEIGDVYAKTREGKAAPLRQVDIHDALPEDLQFLVKGGYTPTFVLIQDGKEYGRIRGYPGESFFWGLLAILIERLPEVDKQS